LIDGSKAKMYMLEKKYCRAFIITQIAFRP
jgi:hypothetical protein